MRQIVKFLVRERLVSRVFCFYRKAMSPDDCEDNKFLNIIVEKSRVKFRDLHFISGDFSSIFYDFVSLDWQRSRVLHFQNLAALDLMQSYHFSCETTRQHRPDTWSWDPLHKRVFKKDELRVGINFFVWKLPKAVKPWISWVSDCPWNFPPVI